MFIKNIAFISCIACMLGSINSSLFFLYRSVNPSIVIRHKTRQVLLVQKMTTTISNDTPYADCTVYWIRNAMRLHDNPSFLEACQKSKTLIPLVVIDPIMPYAQTPNCKPGAIRIQFILESLQDLHSKLLLQNSSLVVLKGRPESVLPRALVQLQATHLFYEKDSAAPVRNYDSCILRSIRESSSNIHVKSFDTHTLFEMEKYVAHCPGHVAPATFGGFSKIFAKMGKVPEEMELIEHIPPLPISHAATLGSMDTYKGNSSSLLFPIPTLEELGYDKVVGDGGIFPGGETEGLNRLYSIMANRKSWVAHFEKPNTSPNALDPATTGLSPYIKHGCVSARTFYHELSKVYSLYPNKHSLPPVSLHGQLMWREYNTLMGYTTPNFDKMIGNPVARNIPWDDDPQLLHAWTCSRTGYPFIDAIMTQLRQTGWIHHLARHAVACFLTRGDLWQSWEKGALVFEEHLIDADWSINNFNWQWLSCTAHFYQYFRCYSPVAFGKKTDPNGDYIRKWLPIFKSFPSKYIYEPWKAPISVQQEAGVVIGNNYPPPIVEHTSVSKANMSRMKAAYDAANNNNNTTTANDNARNVPDQEPSSVRLPPSHRDSKRSKTR
mmetsp:Transcript_27587/g.39483  ORF Transcript_27587/g.39483 Transcript_27587/m.39483 type:complete len:607 (-) Transcript_27587:86-1906(-)